MNKTIAILEKALDHPKLADPGGCSYVNDEGCHCIIGQTLSLLGVSDEQLSKRNNKIGIGARKDLQVIINQNQLDFNFLSQIQKLWDNQMRQQPAWAVGYELKLMMERYQSDKPQA